MKVVADSRGRIAARQYFHALRGDLFPEQDPVERKSAAAQQEGGIRHDPKKIAIFLS